ncbi:uncharacterized protein LOC133706941 [Rosa rugosa]|uniref:uncharacterized protein LOC133706941 n=1 Tax=Rosa rugosa TaxID=74645 RepID=UPI002B417587|nr:uncharacterized protein LOC133706941 [Rosa rugosa]
MRIEISAGKTKQQCLGDGGNRSRFRRPPRRARQWASIYNIFNPDIFLLSRHLSLLQSVLRSVKTRKINRVYELSFFNKVRVSGIPEYLLFFGCDCRHLGDDLGNS